MIMDFDSAITTTVVYHGIGPNYEEPWHALDLRTLSVPSEDINDISYASYKTLACTFSR
jgi:hypothetical protein